MNELATIEQANLVTLDSLAREGRVYAENCALYMLQLGRVLTQAKDMIPFGEFVQWMEEKIGVTERYGQICMKGYATYGEKPEFAKLGKSKLMKMLALPAGTHEDFVQNNDVENMTARQVGEAGKKAREPARTEAETEIESERRARRAAEARAEELANRPPEIPDEVADDLREKDAEIKRLALQAQDAIKQAQDMRRERDEYKRDYEETDALIKQTQALYDDAQRKLREFQSAAAQANAGDVSDPMSDKLTLDAFTDAVHRFTGSCSPFPCMTTTFAAMDSKTRDGFNILLRTVEDWCRRSRRALDNAMTGGNGIA